MPNPFRTPLKILFQNLAHDNKYQGLRRSMLKDETEEGPTRELSLDDFFLAW